MRSRGRSLRRTFIGLMGVALVASACAASPDNDPGARTERPGGGLSALVDPPPTTPAGTFRLASTRASMGGCTLYPPDHYMNAVDVDTLAVDPRSAAWLGDLGGGEDAPVQVTSGMLRDGIRGGTPLNVVDSRETGFTRVFLNYSYSPRSFPGPYPIPRQPKVQGHPGAAWDKRLMVVDTADCRAYELIQYDPFIVALTGRHSALAGASYPLNSTAMPEMTTNAPNTPMIGQYIRADEVMAGEVPHVLAFCSNRISTSHRWPARKSDGQLGGPNSMPMGAWIRLKSDVNPAAFPPSARPVVETLRERGAVLTDTCGHPFSLLTENSTEWPIDHLKDLRNLSASDFEVVDSSPMMADPGSFRIR